MSRKLKGYSFPIAEIPDRSKIALAKGKNLPIKWKHAREIANAVMERGLFLKEAISYLEAVAKMEKPVPFKRFKGNVGHRKGMHEYRWPAGRYPQKAARYILKVLRNALNNARQKNLNEDRLKIIWFATHKSRKLRRRPYRIGPGLYRGMMVKTGTNVEVVVMEVPEELEKAISEAEEKAEEKAPELLEEEEVVGETEGETVGESEMEESAEEEVKILEEEEVESGEENEEVLSEEVEK